LQSGSNKILKMMRRRYLRELYKERVANIRESMPDCCIGVDVITGFPGETDEDFLDTYHFLNELDISYLHVFTYSERDNTVATEMKDPVLLRTRHERTTQLRSLSEKKKRAFYDQFVGTTAQVLFEEERDDQGNMYGFTENYIKVTAKYDPVLVNEIKEVYLSEVNEQGIMQIREVYEYESH
jgi:threonylcarbamoyladenosine tRNA methylthiotransferase MtaB